MSSSAAHWQRTGVIVAVITLIATGVFWFWPRSPATSDTQQQLPRDPSIVTEGPSSSALPGPNQALIEGAIGAANVTAGDTRYNPAVSTSINDVVKLEVYYNNRELDGSNKNANNLTLRIDLEGQAPDFDALASMQGDNTNLIQSSASIVTPTNGKLDFIEGSGVWRHNTGTNDSPNYVDEKIPDTIVAGGFSVGDVPPYYNFSGTITILVRVVES